MIACLPFSGLHLLALISTTSLSGSIEGLIDSECNDSC